MIQALEKSNNALAIQAALSQFGTQMNNLTFMRYRCVVLIQQVSLKPRYLKEIHHDHS